MQTSLRKVVGILVGMRQTRVLQSQAAAPKASRVLKNQGRKGPSSQQGARGNDSHGPQVSLPNLRSYLAKGSEKEVGERNLKD